MPDYPCPGHHHYGFVRKKGVFYIHELLKTSGPGKHYGCLELRAYGDDKQLCVVTFL